MSTIELPTGVMRAWPGAEGANIRTWIGFKHFTYLVEAAVFAWFRDRGHGAAVLYHEHGVGLSIVGCSLLLPAVLDVDDEVSAEVIPVRPGRFTVRLRVDRGGPVTVCRAKVDVALVREPEAPGDRPVPAELADLVVDGVTGDVEPAPPGAFEWSWRAPYFYCQYSDRVAHSGYVRALEETVDRFLAARGISVGRMLTERGWIPVVSRSSVTLLADARMEETIYTSFRVTDVLRGVTYDARMDCHVLRDGKPVHVATATIQHGYAISRGPAAGQLAELDPPVLAALTGGTP